VFQAKVNNVDDDDDCDDDTDVDNGEVVIEID
jgi:hypothetical protein